MMEVGGQFETSMSLMYGPIILNKPKGAASSSHEPFKRVGDTLEGGGCTAQGGQHTILFESRGHWTTLKKFFCVEFFPTD